MATKLVLLLLALSSTVDSANHWIVTKNGRIQAQTHSDYHMAQGHDLLQFLKQERRVDELHQLNKRMMLTDPNVVSAAHLIEPSHRLFYDEQCLGAHERDKRQLNKRSVLLLDDIGVDIISLIGRPAFDPDETIENPLRPVCGDDLLPLPFSMHAFEHLDAMRSRHDLPHGASTPHDDFVPSDFVTAKMFGHHIAQAMYTVKEEQLMWVVYVLAAQFWRMEGNAEEAIECSRRALHLVPRRMAVVPLLDLANVFVDARKADDAIVVLDALLAINETVVDGYCKSGEAYSQMDIPNYNASLYSFDACLLLKADNAAAQRHRQYVLCQLHLLHERGDAPIFDEELLALAKDAASVIHAEHERSADLIDARRSLHRHTMSDADALEQQLFYEWTTLGPFDGGSACHYDKSTAQHRMKCHVKKSFATDRERRHMQKYHTSMGGEGEEEDDRRATRRTSVEGGNHTADVNEYFEDVRKASKNDLSSPAHRPLYPLVSVEHLFPSDWVFQDEQWPSPTLCLKSKATLPTREQIPSIFVSPVDKGWSMRQVLEERLLLRPHEQHPLPWYHTSCIWSSSSLDVPLTDHLLGVQRLQSIYHNDDLRYAEPQLTAVLLNLTGTPVDSSAELGMRALAPTWLLYDVAALYWRVIGAPNEAVACLRLAIGDAATPSVIRASALNQLAQLVERIGGRLDDALVLMKEAQRLDPYEPSHALLIAYYTLNISPLDLTTAAEQLRAALDIDPLYPGALSTFRAVRCAQIGGSTTSVGRASALRPRSIVKRTTDELPLHFCIKLTDDKMGCLTMGRGSSVEHPWSRSPTDVHCVMPPPLLSLFLSWFATVIEEESDAAANGEGWPAIMLSSYDTRVRQRAYERAVELCEIAGYPVGSGSTPSSTTMPKTVDVDAGEEEVIDTTGELALDHDNSEEREMDVAVGVPDNVNTYVYSEGEEEAVVQDFSPPPPPPRHDVETEEDGMRVASTTPHAFQHPKSVRVLSGIDVPLPDKVPRPTAEHIERGVLFMGELPHTDEQCAVLRHKVQLDAATSTWLSVTANSIDLRDYIDFVSPIPASFVGRSPHCPVVDKPGLFTMEHLAGAMIADELLTHYQREFGLRDALETLGGERQTAAEIGARIAMAMKRSADDDRRSRQDDGGVNWTLSTVAALYWRVMGDAKQAMLCLKHSLNNSPNDMRDVALVSLANVYHQLSLLHSALIAGGAALDASPNLVVIHFTLANIYAGLGDLDLALEFYLSTLALQHNFEPARQRIATIYCITGGHLPSNVRRFVDKFEAEGKIPAVRPLPL